MKRKKKNINQKQFSDQPEKPVAPKPFNVPKPEPLLSPVKILKDWFRARKPSSKNKDVLKTVKSHQFVAPGGCELNMAMLPDDIPKKMMVTCSSIKQWEQRPRQRTNTS